MQELNQNCDADTIRAAGGILWRDSPQGRLLAIVHRTRHGDEWTLPKGKLREGESWLSAAIREVLEETGCRVEVGAFAGAIAYEVDGLPKVVRFWHMDLMADPGPPLDAEVDQVAWLPPGVACGRMCHPLERALIGTSLDASAVAPSAGGVA